MEDNDEHNTTPLSAVLVLVFCTCMHNLPQCSDNDKSAFGLMCSVHVYMCTCVCTVHLQWCSCNHMHMQVCMRSFVRRLYACTHNGLDNMCVQVWTCCGKCVGMCSASHINKQDCVIECVALPNLQ